MKRASTIINGMVVGLWGVVLATYFVLDVRPAFDIAKKSKSFKEFTHKVQKDLPGRFPGKYFFIDLNGLFARVVGRNESNNVVKGDDGWLHQKLIGKVNADGLAKKANEFAVLMKKEKIPFSRIKNTPLPAVCQAGS